MKYKINEMANIVGVGIDTLRHYEDKGIIEPQRDENNNYRMYSISDIRKFNSSRMFRSYGFTIQETAELLEWKSLDYIHGKLSDKLNELNKERLFLEEKINKLEAYDKRLNEINNLKDGFLIKEMPSIYYFKTQRVDKYEKNLVNDRLKKQWMDYFPAAEMARRINKPTKESMSEELQYDNGIMIECDKAEKISFPLKLIDLAEKIEGGRVWYTIFNKADEEPYDWHIFNPIFQQISDRGYEVCGEIITFYFSSSFENNTLTNYHYCMIKIK